jgi:hypothetical protein
MQLVSPSTLGFVIGGLYSRRDDVHERFGGQRQGGISTPANFPYIFAFTGEVGRSHGYHDFWDEAGLFHYFGEGQAGDMTLTGGNRAILEHQKNQKRLFVFQMLGHGRPYRFLGEFELVKYREQLGPSRQTGELRKVLVFVLRPMLGPLDDEGEPTTLPSRITDSGAIGATSRVASVQVRTHQWLFRRRVADLEKGCRLTGLSDLRVLRASHVKPWSKCHTDVERIDGNNGLLLCPQADLLFDRGWISLDDRGRLLVASELPDETKKLIGLPLKPGKACGAIRAEQRSYFEYHRESVFERRYTELKDPLGELQFPVT